MKTSLTWIRKYTPKNSDEIVAQKKAINKIKGYISSKNYEKSLLIHGPIGTGKTSSIIAIANDLQLELVEVNASDRRNKNSVEDLLGNAAKQASLFFKGKIILIDEIDTLSGKQDRGAVSAIKDIIKKTKFPVILTAVDAYQDKIKALKKISTLVEFERLNDKDILEHLKHICKKEKVKYEEDSLKTLSLSCNGDLRAAINDLQTFSGDGKFDPSSSDFLLQRNQTDIIQNVLFRIYKTFKPEISLESINKLDINIDKIIEWVEYNTPKEYKKIEDLAMAFDNISLADVFRGRIRRWQHWRFLVYMYQLLSIGISLSKKEKYSSNIEYKRSTKGLLIWQYNMKTAKKKSTAQKLAEATHLSAKQAFKYVDILRFMLKDKKIKDELIKELDLDDSELEWLQK